MTENKLFQDIVIFVSQNFKIIFSLFYIFIFLEFHFIFLEFQHKAIVVFELENHF